MKTIYVKDIFRKVPRIGGIKWKKCIPWKQAVPTFLFLGAMFLLGRSAGEIMSELQQTAATVMESENWGLGFGQEGQKPTGNASAAELKKYDTYFCAEGDEKVIYLTFDCGFENGNTEPILDALKKHNAPATFFVVGHFLESAPEIVKRMVEDGHTVGNHTYHHPDMSKISDISSFRKEMDDVASAFREVTGTTGRPRENTARRTCRWQRNWGIPHFFGAWPMWTGTRIPSPAMRRRFQSLPGVSTPAPLSCCTVPQRQTGRLWMNC